MEVKDLMWTFCKEHQKVGIYRDFQTLLCEHPVVRWYITHVLQLLLLVVIYMCIRMVQLLLLS